MMEENDSTNTLECELGKDSRMTADRSFFASGPRKHLLESLRGKLNALLRRASSPLDVGSLLEGVQKFRAEVGNSQDAAGRGPGNTKAAADNPLTMGWHHPKI